VSITFPIICSRTADANPYFPAKTWLFFLFATVSNLQNGNGAQYSLIIRDFGFNKLQTTLLNIPSGFSQICGITLGCYLLRRNPNSRAYLAMIFFLPSLISAILLMTLHNKTGKLVSYYFYGFGGAPSFAFVVSWVTSTTAGHTKVRFLLPVSYKETLALTRLAL